MSDIVSEQAYEDVFGILDRFKITDSNHALREAFFFWFFVEPEASKWRLHSNASFPRRFCNLLKIELS